jgi:resuscitation-promoting factor RpfB
MAWKLSPSKKIEPLTLVLAFLIMTGMLMTGTSFILARDIVIQDGGDEYRLYTYAHRVEDVLQGAGLTLQDRDLISPGLEEPLPRRGRIEITRAYPVQIRVDGQKLEAWITGGPVGDLLADQGIVLGEWDRVNPPLYAATSPYMDIQVTRIFKQQVTERVVLSHREVRQTNPSLDRGFSRVLKRGHDGLREDVLEIVYADGIRVEQQILQSKILRARQDRIVEEGANTLLTARGGVTLRFVRAMYVTATAYCPGTPESGCPIDERGYSSCNGKWTGYNTAAGVPKVAGSGTAADPHIIAVDPRVIPLRTRVYIAGYGYAQALDTGRLIKGNRIDLLLPTHRQALNFGRRQLKIYLLP